MKRIETNADVERAWIAALSREQVSNPMHTTPPEDDCASYGNDTDVMATIAKSEIRELVAVWVGRIYAERI